MVLNYHWSSCTGIARASSWTWRRGSGHWRCFQVWNFHVWTSHLGDVRVNRSVI